MKIRRKCVIWGTNASVEYDPRDNDKLIFDSPRAGGKYIVEHQRTIGVSNSWNWKNKKKVRFSGYIAKENLLDRIPLNKIPSLDSFLDDEKWLKNLDSTPDNLDERSDLLLKGLAKRYPDKGKPINLDINLDSNLQGNPAPFLCALSYCSNSEDFQFLLFENLEKELKYIKTEDGPYVGGTVSIKITPKGWKRMNEIENKTPSKKSEKVFIAMWFYDSDSMKNLEKNIEISIKKAGYTPFIIKNKEHLNKIDDEILKEINRAKFIICDLTSKKGKPRGSVYFEAGYAIGKDKPVVWTCKKELKKEIPFDVRQYNFLFWEQEKMDDFAKKLQNRIEKTVGKGSLKENKR